MRRDLSALESRLLLRGSLCCLAGLRVGAAKDSSGLGSDLPVLRDARELPYIPGSSFKGVLRSTIEGLVRGVARPGEWSNTSPPKGLWSCNPLEDPSHPHGETRDANEACMSRRWKEVLREHHAGRTESELTIDGVLKHSCTVCRLFGNTELAGRVLVADLPLSEASDLTNPVEVRDGVAIDRDLLTAADRKKYDFEVVPVGSCFDLEIVVENPDDTDRGLLVAGLECINEGFARLGGFGSRGLGRVCARIQEATLRTAGEILSGKPGQTLAWDTLVQHGQRHLAAQLEG